MANKARAALQTATKRHGQTRNSAVRATRCWRTQSFTSIKPNATIQAALDSVHPPTFSRRTLISIRPAFIAASVLVALSGAAGAQYSAAENMPTNAIILSDGSAHTAAVGTDITLVARVPDTVWFRIFVNGVKICDIRQPRPAYACPITTPVVPTTLNIEVRTNVSLTVTPDTPNRSFMSTVAVDDASETVFLSPGSSHGVEPSEPATLLAQVPGTAWLRMFADDVKFCDIRQPRPVYGCVFDVPNQAGDVDIEVRTNPSLVVTPDSPNESFYSTLTVAGDTNTIFLEADQTYTVTGGTPISLVAEVENTAWFRLFVDGAKICDVRQAQHTYTCDYVTPSSPGHRTIEVRLNASLQASDESPNRSEFSTLVVPENGYALHFSDDFDDHHNGLPNPAHWDYKTGPVINNEQQCYTDDHESYLAAGVRNVAVQTRNLEGADNGYLVLSLKKETVACRQADGETFQYTSGAISTRVDGFGTPYLVDMPHGVYEVRAKIPAGRGTWPAIWLLGKKDYSADSPYTIGWPDAGEIDIMEAVGFEEAAGVYRLHHTLHRNRDNGFLWPHGRPNSTGQGMTIELPEPPSARFHTYRMIWSPESIEFFVDGTRVRTMDLGNGTTGQRDGFFRNAPDMNGWGHPNTPLDDHLGWPYAMEAGNRFKMIINLAWGGGWGGQQGLDDSLFDGGQAVEMLVDYVRIYVPAQDDNGP